ncbi:bifunctional hydroxymethylpyrimidine kinase/phosphomethylpyrimidine kinase [Ideonella sp. YS5]|uniref:bifunctional hydroxymethylpyrimidine kinase/phosphomethylpyrimidine kinase n=1 Tax=Ideonella sp. YS5 TaxID=3453714 RepID=UPI003EEFE004
MNLPIVWSIAGTDSGGGAGLSADQRAAEAFGVHLCPVVAGVTSQNSVAVHQVRPVPPEWLDEQLAALAADMPPAAIKCGLLGSADNLRVLVRWLDRLRADHGPVPLIVDPVLGASTGRTFADAALLAAYRDELLPRTTLLSPNRREAARLLGQTVDDADHTASPALARALQQRGVQAVAITGGDSADLEGRVLDWIATPQAAGWLAASRIATPHHHGTGCTFATSAAAAMALGHVAADALVLAKMSTSHALRHASAAGQGAGPVRARPGFGLEPSLMPSLSWGEEPVFADFEAQAPAEPLGLYAIVESAARVREVLAAGVRTVQLRIKADSAGTTDLREQIAASVRDCRDAGAELFVNDHWALAVELGSPGVHLGQEDLLELGESGRAALAASKVALGISSHSLWELARARAVAPRYIACGPVWPTLTKAMPWVPQGLDNLRWWSRMAGHPVVAIGGILTTEQAELAAACGPDGVCVVRGLSEDPDVTVPAFQRAIAAGRRAPCEPPPSLPHPMLGRMG